MDEEKLYAYTIYFNTSDYPDLYSVRKFDIKKSVLPLDLLGVFYTIHDARNSIPPHRVCFARNNDDDPVIVETWL